MMEVNSRPIRSNPASESGAEWPLSLDLDPFDALLFDLDGTLIDTMPLHGKAYAEVFAGYGYSFGMADYLAHVGPPARIAIPLFATAAGMTDVTDELVGAIHKEKKKRFKDILASGRAPSLPALELLERYAGTKPMALVTSGNRDGVEAIMRVMGWDGLFGAVITGDEVTQGKPHAEPYATAARALGVSPANCIAFEDTKQGMQSALAAGMAVVDVTRPGTVHKVDAAS